MTTSGERAAERERMYEISNCRAQAHVGVTLAITATPRRVDLEREDLAAAGCDGLRLGHAAPFGGHHEKRCPVGAAEGAGEAAAVQFNRLEDRAPLDDAHAALVGDVGVPGGVLRVDAYAVRCAVAEVGPDPTV